VVAEIPSPSTSKLLERARNAFRGAPNLLETIGWPRSIERAYFASGCEKLPEPVYEIDRDASRTRLDALDALDCELVGDDALVRLLRARTRSHRLGEELVLAVGTPTFFELSREIYGSARTSWLDGDTTNLAFADHVASRLTVDPDDDDDEPEDVLDAAGLAATITERLEKRRRPPDLNVVLDEDLGAKAIAGKKRLRIRADATFTREEARSLFLHEVETHVFTAQNGDLQPHLDFLDSGGPLSTRTQEGLAVFSELYAQALTIGRLRRLAERVKLVAMAEDGANFIELHRYLRDKGVEPRAAYLDVARVCRGGKCEGGAPFTKDAAYLGGLMEVYNFLRLSVGPRGRRVAAVLVSGRLALDEVEPLVALADDGLLAPPAFVPGWLRRWDDLLTHFTFSSFLNQIDLDFVAKRHPWLANGRPRERPPAET
jgi:uncharacterized protein (TIGR02421 family)